MSARTSRPITRRRTTNEIWDVKLAIRRLLAWASRDGAKLREFLGGGGFGNLRWRAAPERLRPSPPVYDSEAIFSRLKAPSHL